MGSRNYNIYIRSSELDTVDRGLTAIFQREGYHRIPKPAPHIIENYRRLYYYIQSHEDPRWDSLRAASIFPSGGGWMMMQTHPSDILYARVAGSQRPRLADLAVELGCDVFQLNLYDSDTLILLEANADGEIAFSGFGLATPEELEALIPKEQKKERFYLLQVPPEIELIMEDEETYIVDKVEAIAAMLCGFSFEYYEDNMGDLVFNPNGELEAPGARALYFQRDTGPLIE